MRILIVEDNPVITDTLRHELKKYYKIDTAKNGKEGLELINSEKYAAIILDLGLPDIRGEEICWQIRGSNIKTPILILSGKSEIKSKVEMFNLGAGDYVTKPFNFYELQARIGSMIRRSNNKELASKIIIDNLILDSEAREVTHSGKKLKLRRKEFDLLEYLMRNKDQVLTRLMIIEEIWDINENSFANIVDVHIKYLRDKVDRPFNTSMLRTVHGIGYKIQSSKTSNGNGWE